ncbi:GLPGLI family protein [Faecalibacter bovis]|uniref:GLPGLI family protein n=1 Tax=Faecalibacter bovis TaxID=2898187 RepID=A0ABX7XAG9_9FLAO|nr:GLPGLI family protein [Faecalibacter bovis]QTV04891.1 GLPGLI family protein [Faecalibacter bovis]
MKNLIVLLIFYVSNSVFGQQNNFIIKYNLEYKKDSMSYHYDNDVMLLLYSHDKSIFIPENLYKVDSIMNLGTANFSMISSLPKSNYKFHIKKDENRITYFDRIYTTNIYYEQRINFDWEITDETLNLNGYLAKKAITNFGGRKWIAWYTEEIPVSDGPYKFYGLPGLIIKIRDENNNFNFELISLKNELKSMNILENNFIKITKDDFKKLRRDFLDDPIYFINKGDVKTNFSSEIMDRIILNVNKNNNFLELE